MVIVQIIQCQLVYEMSYNTKPTNQNNKNMLQQHHKIQKIPDQGSEGKLTSPSSFITTHSKPSHLHGSYLNIIL